jgi:hypothetical protein
MAQWARRGRRRRRRGWPMSAYWYAEEADNDGAAAAGDIGSGVRCGDAVAPQEELVSCAAELLETAVAATGTARSEEVPG